MTWARVSHRRSVSYSVYLSTESAWTQIRLLSHVSSAFHPLHPPVQPAEIHFHTSKHPSTSDASFRTLRVMLALGLGAFVTYFVPESGGAVHGNFWSHKTKSKLYNSPRLHWSAVVPLLCRPACPTLGVLPTRRTGPRHS